MELPLEDELRAGVCGSALRSLERAQLGFASPNRAVRDAEAGAGLPRSSELAQQPGANLDWPAPDAVFG
jgi:hypothetical protein